MTDWWQNAGLGLFIHFGLYSLLGGEYKGQKMDYIGEWIQAKYHIPNAEYSELAKSFNPEKFNADEYIKLAHEAGCRYIVFTAKHHEGFCNFRTEHSDFSIWNYQKRDLVRELAEACRKYGVRLGLYYSQDLDWHEKNGGGYNTELANYGMSWCNDWDFPHKSEKDFDSYFYGKAIPQIKELLTNYGDVSLIWFDCPLDIDPKRAEILRETVKSLQPNCLINSRICMDGKTGCDYFGLGDNSVAAYAKNNRQESAITLNDTWGYKYFDNNWKTPETVINIISECVSANTNLLINIGPKGDGAWPEESINVFSSLAKWMKINSCSIHGNTNPKAPMSTENYKVTQKNNRLYIHFLKNTDAVELVHVLSDVKDCKVLGDIYPIKWSQTKQNDLNIINVFCNGNTAQSVIELDFDSDIILSDNIIEQNDCIVLDSAKAQINVNEYQKNNELQIIGPAGEKFTTEIQINEQGVLTNWYDTNINLKWDFIIRHTGKYKATLVTSALYHMAEWKGDHEVHIQTDCDKTVSTALKNDGYVKEAGHIYKQANSFIGTIEFNHSGKNSLSLIADKIIKENTPGLAIRKLILEK